MAIRTQHELTENTWFVTFTCFNRMPNHVHLLLYLTDKKVNLNAIISNAKRFMAYDLIAWLEQQQNYTLLNVLSQACTAKEKANGQLHKVFEPSFDAKPIYTDVFLHQKLAYIHRNPLNGKWNLCNEFTDYPHSSAAFYHLEKPHPHIAITDYRYYWY